MRVNPCQTRKLDVVCQLRAAAGPAINTARALERMTRYLQAGRHTHKHTHTHSQITHTHTHTYAYTHHTRELHTHTHTYTYTYMALVF